MTLFSVALPIAPPIDPRSGWSSPRSMGEHQGFDFAAPDGRPVFAIAPGKVILSKDHNATAGNWIVIAHDSAHTGLFSRYIHLQKRLVELGKHVYAGQQIGRSGETASEGQPHLHFDISAAPQMLETLKKYGLKKVGREAGGTGGARLIPVEQFVKVSRISKEVVSWPLIADEGSNSWMWLLGGLAAAWYFLGKRR